jgi:hypothetical protein
VIFGVAPDYTPATAMDKERTHFAFGHGDAYLRARVLSVRPRSPTQVEIESVNEDDNVHTAEIGETTPPRQVSQLSNYVTAPHVVGLTGISVPGSPEKMLLMWQPSVWANEYLIEQSGDGVEWTRCGDTRASNYTATALYGSSTLIRVAAVGMARGPWVTINYGLLADYMWAADDTTLMWSGNDNNAMWRF